MATCLSVKSRPELAVGDGSLGFWKALAKVYDNTQWQRLYHSEKLAEVIEGIKFVNEIEENRNVS